MTYPIVLAHGVCRFDAPWSGALHLDNNDDPGLDKLHYFKGIRTMLKDRGYAVHHSRVSWAAGVGKRARDLRRNILEILEESRTEKVNVIAHSMGGLDARHMMFDDRNEGKIHRHVASLTTISTPHWGSPFADWGIRNLPKFIPIVKALGLDLQALDDLRVTVCSEFNRNPEVVEFQKECEIATKFQTFAGRQKYWAIFSPLKLPFSIIEKSEGENDGLVSVRSAKWDEKYFKGIIDETDHLNELGWWDGNQLLAGESPGELLRRMHQFYNDIASELP